MTRKRLSGAVLAAACLVLTHPGTAQAADDKSSDTAEQLSPCTAAIFLERAHDSAKDALAVDLATAEIVAPVMELITPEATPAPAPSAPSIPGPLSGTWLTQEHMDNAAAIINTAKEMGLPRRAWEIGIATAIQESTLININWGDRDSVGLFQQRPSAGWGSVEQIMDRGYASRMFFEALLRVPGWESMALTVAAQTVQYSAFPDHYAKHEPISIAIVDAFIANGF